MSSAASSHQKPHAVCVPFPAQGHITPMLAFAKLLHASGYYITFVNTEYNHRRLLRSLGETSLTEIPDFQFATIPDGLPFCDEDSAQDIGALCASISTTASPHFRDLLRELNNANRSSVPRVTCVVADLTMTFAPDAAKEIEVPCAFLWTSSACSFMGFFQYQNLIGRGLVPLKDPDQLSNGYLDASVDSVPGMTNMKLRDFPTLIRTTDPNDAMLNYSIRIMESQSKASVIIMHTFEELEKAVLSALKSIMSPPIYCVGPLEFQVKRIISGNSLLKSLRSNLLVEEQGCLEWLENKEPRSVVYVNFGSISALSRQKMVELAYGIANSKYQFVWILRQDMFPNSGTETLPEGFLQEVKERGLIARWCPQSDVLAHEAIGIFITHNGWNSTLESVSNGVPMLCLPLGANQQTNCRYVCKEWRIGMEIEDGFGRDDVEKLVREMMEREEGRRVRERVMEWKESAKKATQRGGSSFVDARKLVREVLASKNE